MSSTPKIIGAILATAILVGGGTYLAMKEPQTVVSTSKDSQSIAPKSKESQVTASISMKDKMLLKLSSQMNENLPMMVDKETRLDNTMGLNGEIRYMYTLVNMTIEELDVKMAHDLLKDQIVNSFCTTEEMQGFIKNDITASYHYYDKNKKFVTKVIVTPAECKKINKG